MQSLVNDFIDKQLYPRQMTSSIVPNSFNVNGTRCLLQTTPAATSWLMYCHGNTDSISNINTTPLVSQLVQWTQRRCNIIIPEFPALPSSSKGEARDEDMVASVYNAYIEIQQKFNNPPIYVMAHSLGVALALHACANLPKAGAPAGMLLVSGFSSVRNLAPSVVSCLIPDRLNNLTAIARIPASVPVTIIHGTEDTLIPVDHADALLDACLSFKKQLHKIKDGHNIVRATYEENHVVPKLLHQLTQSHTSTIIMPQHTFHAWTPKNNSRW